jgi:hypothetical protein
MGIVRSLKARYRRRQLADLFASFDLLVASGSKEQFDVKKATHLSRCLDWLKAAWDDVPANLVRRCWAKAAVLPAPMNALLEQDVDRSSAFASEVDDLARLLNNTVLGAKRGIIDGFVHNNNVVDCCEALLAFDNDEEAIEIDQEILWTQQI